ncbi:ankyrin-3-like [Physella acuta]|uniref:ankyrin-3-like n=1 Tax=Physella acuta TaxID=109671 RepID=UPI0027DC89D5|nr:ankyrin-3-like [Physella acuta]
MVELLIQTGADVSVRDTKNWNSLMYAASKGHVSTVELLLKHNANQFDVNEEGNNTLMVAADNGKVEIVKLLLEHCADISTRNKVGQNALYLASLKGHNETVSVLITHKADIMNINTKDDKGWDSLMAAVSKNRLSTVALLLKNKIDFCNINNDGFNALMIAAQNGCVDILKLLLDHKFDQTLRDTSGNDSLMLASLNGHSEIVELLVQSGGEIHNRNNGGWNALMCAVSKGHLETVEMLLKHHANPSDINDEGSNALMISVAKGHVDVVRLLLKQNPDTSTINQNGQNALFLAALVGHCEIIKILLESKADIHSTNNVGWNSLMAAASKGHVNAVELLLQHKANVLSRNTNGQHALHVASQHGHVEVVKLLLDKLNLNDKDKNGWTSLMAAAYEGHLDTVKTLLDNGAIPSDVNNDGSNAFMLAALNGKVEIVKLFLKSQVDILATNNQGQNALYLSSLNGHIEIVKILLENKVDINKKDNRGWNSLMAAVSTGHLSTVKLLLQNKTNQFIVNAFHIAVEYGQLEIVQLLLKQHVNVSIANKSNQNALLIAASKGYDDIIELLLKNKADIASKNKSKLNSVMLATLNGHTRTVQLLLKHGCSQFDVNKDGSTALMIAAETGNVDIVKLFLKDNSDVSTKNNLGINALYLASMKGHMHIVDLLLQHKADVHSSDNAGTNVLMIAASNGHFATVKLLLKNEARLADVNLQGYNAADLAAISGHSQILDLLIHKKFALNSTNQGQWTEGKIKSLNSKISLDCQLLLLINAILFYERQEVIKVLMCYIQDTKEWSLNKINLNNIQSTLKVVKYLYGLTEHKMVPIKEIQIHLAEVLSEFAKPNVNIHLFEHCVFEKCCHFIYMYVDTTSKKNLSLIAQDLVKYKYAELSVKYLQMSKLFEFSAHYYMGIILETMKGFSDNNRDFLESLAQSGIAKVLIKHLGDITEKEINQSLYIFIGLAVGVLFNLTLIWNLENERLKLLKILSNLMHVKDDELVMSIKILITFLDAECDVFVPTKDDLEMLKQWMEKALTEENRAYKGFSLSSLTQCLEKFYLKSKTGYKILHATPMSSIHLMLNSKNLDEQEATLDWIKAIVRQKYGKQLIRRNADVVDTLNRLSMSDKKSIKQKAKSVILVIKRELIRIQDDEEIISAEFPDHWAKADFIARGQFGTVYHIEDKLAPGLKKYIAKYIVIEKNATDHSLNLMELSILMKIEHARIVKFHGFKRETQNKLVLFFDFMKYGSIKSYIKDKPLQEKQIRIFTRQIIEGLHYLHTFQPPIVHRDIKGDNILLENENSVKLSDFGTSKLVNDFTKAKTCVGTVKWMAPEVMIADHQQTCGCNSDIWSVGCTVIEMATGNPPCYQYPDTWYILHISSPNKPLYELPDWSSQEMISFLDQTLQHDVMKRPSAKTLLDHPFTVTENSD